MIFLALIVVLAAWLAFVWIVEPDHFMRRTSKRMVKPPLPPPDNKNGASNMYTVYYGLSGSGELPPHSRDKRLSKSFVDLPEALIWAQAGAAGGAVIFGIEGAGLELDRDQANALLEPLTPCRESGHNIAARVGASSVPLHSRTGLLRKPARMG